MESHRRPGLVLQEGLQLSSKTRVSGHDDAGEQERFITMQYKMRVKRRTDWRFPDPILGSYQFLLAQRNGVIEA